MKSGNTFWCFPVISAYIKQELIIKDIHHRMKNQLASLQSLLNIAADKTEALNVINTYAVLYDLLCYRSDNQEDVELCLYVRTILRYIGDTMAHNQDAFGFQVNDTVIQLSSKVSLNVGLIINELATNSIKHVQGRVHLTVFLERSDTALRVAYADNGKNFVKSKIENSQGVGFIIIKSRVDQMQGKMTIHEAAHASVEIVIPIKRPA
jgi:two-component sensor histidine kinase